MGNQRTCRGNNTPALPLDQHRNICPRRSASREMSLSSPGRNLKTAPTDFKEATKGPPDPTTSEASARGALALRCQPYKRRAERHANGFRRRRSSETVVRPSGKVSDGSPRSARHSSLAMRQVVGLPGRKDRAQAIGVIGSSGPDDETRHRRCHLSGSETVVPHPSS